MRSQKGSRKIVVGTVEYRWRATGNDGYIAIGIWPATNVGPFIYGNFRYHETWLDNGDGSHSSAKDQIVITNRLVKRIIGHAIATYGYNPEKTGELLKMRNFDEAVKWDDAVRGMSY